MADRTVAVTDTLETFRTTYNSTAGDFLSNGYRLRGTNASTNSNGGDYVYMAFAKHPFVSSEGVPVHAE